MDIENMDIEDVKAELIGRSIKVHHKNSEKKLSEKNCKTAKKTRNLFSRLLEN